MKKVYEKGQTKKNKEKSQIENSSFSAYHHFQVLM